MKIRALRHRTLDPGLDVGLPVLFVRIGHYPLHHGTVGAIRSLGRLGVPVYAVTEGRGTPAALSRYLAGRFVWPTSGAEPRAQLLAGLRRIGEQVAERTGRSPVLAVPTDDEAAALLAEHRDWLTDLFLLPPVDPGLPGQLADKQHLFDLCREHEIPAPGTVTIDTPAGLREAIEFINTNKRAAADIYLQLSKEKSKPEDIVAQLNDPALRYDLTLLNVMKYFDFMHSVGTIKVKPASWKEIFAPEAHGLPGS